MKIEPRKYIMISDEEAIKRAKLAVGGALIGVVFGMTITLWAFWFLSQ